jgi:hypothetical protein
LHAANQTSKGLFNRDEGDAGDDKTKSRLIFAVSLSSLSSPSSLLIAFCAFEHFITKLATSLTTEGTEEHRGSPKPKAKAFLFQA